MSGRRAEIFQDSSEVYYINPKRAARRQLRMERSLANSGNQLQDAISPAQSSAWEGGQAGLLSKESVFVDPYLHTFRD
jgi:hypothetical protein